MSESDTLAQFTNEQIVTRIGIFENNVRAANRELKMYQSELQKLRAKITENSEKLKLSKQLPYLVSNVIEILELLEEDEEDEPI